MEVKCEGWSKSERRDAFTNLLDRLFPSILVSGGVTNTVSTTTWKEVEDVGRGSDEWWCLGTKGERKQGWSEWNVRRDKLLKDAQKRLALEDVKRAAKVLGERCDLGMTWEEVDKTMGKEWGTSDGREVWQEWRGEEGRRAEREGRERRRKAEEGFEKWLGGQLVVDRKSKWEGCKKWIEENEDEGGKELTEWRGAKREVFEAHVTKLQANYEREEEERKDRVRGEMRAFAGTVIEGEGGGIRWGAFWEKFKERGVVQAVAGKEGKETVRDTFEEARDEWTRKEGEKRIKERERRMTEAEEEEEEGECSE
ncbi:hypothetical protein TrCOL_g8102 [Triparma columacea]|uniref:Uncharacterized protein n=1 Tax=Triparma columacea TaxID=722753 RepID=A0A9W7GFG3_9STRA|nr:hypothetical protein TrCOL_g8102 [Triparma columacea]